MGRRLQDDLDDLFDAWARWCVSGSLTPASKTVLARWMENRGVMIQSSGGGDAMSIAAFPLEERVEHAVVEIAREDVLNADVLRLEYDAGSHLVVRRRRIRGYDARHMTQSGKAHALRISVRTYRRRLARSRDQVERMIGDG